MAQVVSIPIIGIGGIVSARDALEFLLVGASAVEVGTANFINPLTASEVVDGIESYLQEQGYKCITDFIGLLE